MNPAGGWRPWPRCRAGRVSVGVLIGLAVTLLVAAVGQLTWPDHLELKLLDVRHRLFPPREAASPVVCIVIDDESLQQIGRWPWPRRRLAQFVDLCRQAGASLVVLDISLPEDQPKEVQLPGVTDVRAYETPPAFLGQPPPEVIDNDALLCQAISQAGNVLLPFYVRLGPPGPAAQPPPAAPADSLDRQIGALLGDQPNLDFPALYARLRPQARPDDRDPDYQRLRLAYVRRLAQRSLARFGLARPPAAVALPLPALYDWMPPLPYFAAVIADSGFVSFRADKDGVVRRMSLLGCSDGRYYKQFAFAAACQALQATAAQIDLSQPGRLVLRRRPEAPPLIVPLDEQGQLSISWTGDWRSDPSYLSIRAVLALADRRQALADNQRALQTSENLRFQLSTVPNDLAALDEPARRQVEQFRQALARLPSPDELTSANRELEQELAAGLADLHQRLADKIVLVGSVATGAPDFVVTPASHLTPGVVVHRRILETLLNGSFLRRAPRAADVAAVLALGLLMTMIAAIFPPRVSGLSLLAFVPLTVGANFYLVFGRYHLWWALVAPLAAILASFTAVTFYRQITEGRERRRITVRFKQYAAPAVVDRIMQTGAGVALAGELREITCYFSDLAGFTAISERLGPQGTVSVLNAYLDRMTEVLDRYEATINKFEGDGIFAFFGAPIARPDHARLGCLAALDAQQELARLVDQRRRTDPAFPELTMRIGLSTGRVVVGDCGSQRRFDYTAIGDTVNLAARLESAGKAFGAGLLICQEAHRQGGADLAARYLGRIRVVGKQQGVGVYELLGRAADVAAAQREYAARFAAAVQAFQNGDFTQTCLLLEQCLQQTPHDKAALLYLDHARRFARQGPPEPFTGCLELAQK